METDESVDFVEGDLENPPQLTEEQLQTLEKQNSRKVSDFQANKLEAQAARNWDLFYKRNETKFFKDRNWTTREFYELIGDSSSNGGRKFMLEVGCGVGNLIFPLIADKMNDYFIYACDFSPRAIDFVRQNNLYDEKSMNAFTCDITSDEEVFSVIPEQSLDIITMIFVLSAIHPNNFQKVASTLFRLLKPGGVVLFRDYGLHDMAQLRFKPGNKIDENFYVRQDGTRTYFFDVEETRKMFETAGFEVVQNSFVSRRTINKKENIDVKRWFLQGKYRRPS